MIAICPVGPPKLMKPSFSQKRNASAKLIVMVLPGARSPNAEHARWERAAAAKRGIFLLRSEEHTSELQSQSNLVCRLLLEKKKRIYQHRASQPPADTFGVDATRGAAPLHPIDKMHHSPIAIVPYGMAAAERPAAHVDRRGF